MNRNHWFWLKVAAALALVLVVSVSVYSMCGKGAEPTVSQVSATAIVSADTLKVPAKLPTYKEVSYPTPNFDAEKVNEVQGVILHHTAEPTVERSLYVLTKGPRQVGTHVVIDTDGTRYVMCEPTTVTYHAGKSLLNGREGCNAFTIGIEFQGNTLEQPLTDNQVYSAIEYLLPIMEKYNVQAKNVVTHEMVRQAYKKKHPKEKCYNKVDITQVEYKKFMQVFSQVLERQLPSALK